MSKEEYYHVRITTESNSWGDEIKLDLSKGQLTERFLNPYENGDIITVNGKPIKPNDIIRIKINRTAEKSAGLLPKIITERKASNDIVLGISDEWYVTDKGEDITDELIKGPPGYKRSENIKKSSKKKEIISKTKKVFVVHGHDGEMKLAVARSLEKLDLEPIILHEQPNKGRTIIEKFEDCSEDIPFAIVLLSPEDKGCEVKNFPGSSKLRTRQNVILELGYFIGKLGRNNVLVLFKEEDDFELPSDILGILFTPFKNGWELEMVKELQSCGFNVDANKLLKGVNSKSR
ncbi:MAG: nucleotide-binding protein [Candidatus Methanoperedens sp.]|nr:nucleotide-binding protein [Candidatus Methanoperedens sp.]MCE8426920.1 nucleotide-binding protein [Candidatus Methanoperedens sp.]